MHGPYWYLYRSKKGGKGRTSEYVGKARPGGLADEFGVPDDEKNTGQARAKLRVSYVVPDAIVPGSCGPPKTVRRRDSEDSPSTT